MDMDDYYPDEHNQYACIVFLYGEIIAVFSWEPEAREYAKRWDGAKVVTYDVGLPLPDEEVEKLIAKHKQGGEG